tara:strand:- start:58 stop:333 length:276 start_codon:yes stop_codon:yes gene_type:complete
MIYQSEISAKDILRNITQGGIKFLDKRPTIHDIGEHEFCIYPSGSSYVLVFKRGNDLVEWQSDSGNAGVNTVHTAGGKDLHIQNGKIIAIK